MLLTGRAFQNLRELAVDEPAETGPCNSTSLAWLETWTRAPPWPRRIILRAAYFVTSRAPRSLTAITRSNTSMSVSWGVAICLLAVTLERPGQAVLLRLDAAG